MYNYYITLVFMMQNYIFSMIYKTKITFFTMFN